MPLLAITGSYQDPPLVEAWTDGSVNVVPPDVTVVGEVPVVVTAVASVTAVVCWVAGDRTELEFHCAVGAWNGLDP